MTRIEYLEAVKRLNEWAHHYYELDSPIASDGEYDALYRAVEAYEALHPASVAANSPTQKVGGEILKDFSKNKHKKRMWSLEDVFDENDLKEWLTKLSNALGRLDSKESRRAERSKASIFDTTQNLDSIKNKDTSLPLTMTSNVENLDSINRKDSCHTELNKASIFDTTQNLDSINHKDSRHTELEQSESEVSTSTFANSANIPSFAKHISPPPFADYSNSPAFADSSNFPPPLRDSHAFPPPLRGDSTTITPPLHHNMTGGLGGGTLQGKTLSDGKTQGENSQAENPKDSKDTQNLDSINIENLKFCISPKYDGMSLNLYYKNGVLQSATTRGDGEIGEVVTQNAKMIESIPQTISFKGEIEIRGEVVMAKDVFDALNAMRESKGESPFANPRNAASGSMRQLDSNLVKERHLTFIPWGIGYCSDLTTLKHMAKETLLHNAQND